MFSFKVLNIFEFMVSKSSVIQMPRMFRFPGLRLCRNIYYWWEYNTTNDELYT